MSYLKIGESMFEALDVKVAWTYPESKRKYQSEFTGILNFSPDEVKSKDLLEIRELAIQELSKHCNLDDAVVHRVEIMTHKEVNY